MVAGPTRSGREPTAKRSKWVTPSWRKCPTPGRTPPSTQPADANHRVADGIAPWKCYLRLWGTTGAEEIGRGWFFLHEAPAGLLCRYKQLRSVHYRSIR